MPSKQDPIKLIKAALTESCRIDHVKTPVDVSMDGDCLIIEGMVERVSQKKKIMLAAMSLNNVTGVVDRLLVRPASRMTDAEIRDHVHASFIDEPVLKETEIRIEVERGIVDIEGKVGSLSHKRMAGALAWWVPGVTDVINSLEVVPPEEDNADEITDALRLIFEKDRLVDASAITISVSGWTVTLDGTAPGEAEREAAEDDAWCVWGVNDVISRITISTTGARH